MLIFSSLLPFRGFMFSYDKVYNVHQHLTSLLSFMLVPFYFHHPTTFFPFLLVCFSQNSIISIFQATGGIFEDLDSGNPASFFHANYSIASVVPSGNNADQKPYNTLVLHKQEGQKIFSI
jgi:hypothetical protein